MVRIFSGWSQKFPDIRDISRIVRKISGKPGKFLDSLNIFRLVQKVLINQTNFLIMPKVTRQSSIILDGETISHAKMIYAHFFVANTINAHFFVAKVI